MNLEHARSALGLLYKILVKNEYELQYHESKVIHYKKVIESFEADIEKVKQLIKHYETNQKLLGQV